MCPEHRNPFLVKRSEDRWYDVSLAHTSRHAGVGRLAVRHTSGGDHEVDLGTGGRTPKVDVDRHPVPQGGCEFIRATDRHQTTMVEHSHTVGDSACLTEKVCGEDDGTTVFSGERSDQIGDVSGGGRIEPTGRLIEEQQLGVVDQSTGQRKPLALPGREADGCLVGIVGHGEPFELLVDASTSSCSIEPADARCELEVLARSQAVVEPGVLREHSSPSANRVALGRRVEPEHLSGAAVWSKDAVEESNRGRLAGSIGAEQCQHLTSQHAEIEFVERNSVAERAREAAGPDRQVGHNSSQVPICSRSWSRATMRPASTSAGASAVGDARSGTVVVVVGCEGGAVVVGPEGGAVVVVGAFVVVGGCVVVVVVVVVVVGGASRKRWVV